MTKSLNADEQLLGLFNVVNELQKLLNCSTGGRNVTISSSVLEFTITIIINICQSY